MSRRAEIAGIAVLFLAVSLLAAAPLSGQRDSVTVVSSNRYRSSDLHEWLLGEGYRDLWSAPIRVEVLDLSREGGGLTPVQRGGSIQTLGLRFRGADGQEYNFRSIDKELTPALPSYAQETLADWVRQDVTSAQMPIAPIVATPLLDAVGVLNPAPRLVVLPDDPALGEYREEFAGMFGTFEYHPNEIEDGVGGFAGSMEVEDTEGMLDDVEDDPINRVDTRGYLTARLVDMLIGDWDRHEGQWRWARYDSGGIRRWVPIAEDRDYAFVAYGGVLLEVAKRSGLARLVSFDDDYSALPAMMANSLELNRRLLAGLSQADWDSVAVFVQGRITDAVIGDALGRMPPSFTGPARQRLETDLRTRRDALPALAREWYLLMAEMVEVHSTDADEVADVERRSDGSVELVITAVDGTEVYRRHFLPDQTQEVRIDLHGGDDRALVRGADGPIMIRLLGGGGDDRLEDASPGPAVLYDSQGNNEFIPGRNTRIDRRDYEEPADESGLLPRSDRDWGKSFSLSPHGAWRSHVGVVVGLGASWTRYGFRADPFRTRHSFTAVVSPTTGRAELHYVAQLRRENSDRWLELRGEASTLNALRFHGFGNAREHAGDVSRVWLREVILEPRWHLPVGGRADLIAGAVAKYTDPSFQSNAPASELESRGSAPIGQVQATAGIEYDGRDDPWFPSRGVDLTVRGMIAPPVWNIDRTYGRVDGTASAYLPLPLWNEPVLAIRAGGSQLWGEFPFHEAAFLGGSHSLRGFQRERFAGDAMLFGNGEVRLPLAEVDLILRGDLGVSGLVDAGRVYVDGASPGGWHGSAGGALWFATPVGSVSVTYARGEGNRFYADIGMPF